YFSELGLPREIIQIRSTQLDHSVHKPRFNELISSALTHIR
ncbi:MAG: hypothetical protein ACI915_005108, partial [Gammaproteobacteria bacterium]